MLSALASLLLAAAATIEPLGSLRGQVVDFETKVPLSGVTVTLVGTDRSSTTDERGTYALTDVPVGSYNVLFRVEGRPDLYRADILVRSARATFLNAEMRPSLRRDEQITVADYFQESESKPLGLRALAGEELRRTAPGGDLSRALFVLPGAVQAEDAANDLVVRGGSPAENAYYIDNIPVPNINHFPEDGASGGGISMVNIDFVEDVRLLTGGFGAEYGGRLSSVVDITYREGSRSAFSGQLDVNMTGFSAGFEGPLPRHKGSWMISAKRSYLELLKGSLNLTTDSRWSDVQGKVVWDLGPRQRLTLLSIHGQSDSSRSESWARATGDAAGNDNYVQNTTGINWRALWGTRGVSNTSLSYAVIDADGSWHNPDSTDAPYVNDYRDGALSLRNINRIQLTPTRRIEFGIEASHRRGRAFNRLSDADVKVSGWTAAVFGSYTFSPSLAVSLGLRADRDPFSGRTSLAPRLSASYSPLARLTFSAAYGLYNQSLPFALVKQVPSNASLPPLQATHYVAGLAYRLSAATRVTLEVYDKEYRHFPLSAKVPARFVLDDVAEPDRSFWTYGELQDTGRAFSRGIELMLQKKLTKSFYGVVSGSLFRARYRDLDGVWRNRLFDNRYVANIVGGYRPTKYWELTARWVLAGGKGSTPYQVWTWPGGGTASLDWSRWKMDHLPAYHTLGLRFDRRYYFRRMTLSTYVAAWNVYGRKNVRYYYWNATDSRLQASYQWGRIPFFGLELEF